MKKRRKGGNLILTTGIILIVLVTFCAFEKDSIINKYLEYNINKKYPADSVNDYYVEDNFNYVDNYTDAGIKSEEELINYIYFAINSGSTTTERYIDKNYTNYIDDINYLISDNGKYLKEQISILNNFVHPYNSSNSINVTYNDNYKIALKINKAYTDEEIEEINAKVDSIIESNITSNMPVKEKIRVIHDYIIDNTEYDKLKYENKNDTTYKSNTAYGVLIEGYGTCNGYSDAMAIFLSRLNVINYKISNTEHIWNLVYLDGKWYHLDLTWDDPISDINVNRDTYFLITTDTLEKINDGTHDFDKKIYSEA